MLNVGTLGPGGTFLGGGFLTSGWHNPVGATNVASAFSQSTHTVNAITYTGSEGIKRVKRLKGGSNIYGALFFDRCWS